MPPLYKQSQPATTLLSQVDDPQSGIASTVTYYALVLLLLFLLFSVPAFVLFRLRYPCFTLPGLRDFINMLDVMAQECIKKSEPTNFMDGVNRLRQQVNDIEHEQRTMILYLSSVHKYFCSSVIALWNITKCYDEARVLHVDILKALDNKRRAFENFEDSYRHGRRDNNVDADTNSSIAIGHTTARL
ncbi:hypothetical protein K435DRAFT_875541 [Dendrothele bispora CBS 962.96]|uniref:Uncharacterized protein n=1 Tax=Dendrothele bispora (strain CBS 962.96) TaxID=1314807 RepID=A0A4S8KUG0_DENBC|nr:hypothetical protein K435DRAFT_875541 [Dendrothele bispora CBS 962.96]